MASFGERTCPGMRGSPAVFLDRDGVLTELVVNPATGGYEAPHSPDEMKLMPGIRPAIDSLRTAGFRIYVVSNQPDYATGKCNMKDLEAVHEKMMSELASIGVTLDGVYYCYHHPKGIVPQLTKACDCRKPRPGMLLTAAREHNLDPTRSWMIGDRDIDVQSGLSAGCQSLLLAYPHTADRRSQMPPIAPIMPDLVEAATWICSRQGIQNFDLSRH